MLNLLKDAWAGLDARGRTVLVICVALIIVAAIAYRADLTSIWAMLGLQ